MKIVIILFIQGLLFMQVINAQTTPVPNTNLENYNGFMKKRNMNNTIGWVCLGTGLGMGVIGIAEGVTSGLAFNLSNGDRNTTKGTGLFIAGNVVALASVPFFINAHKNKRKASLALKGENVTINNRTLFTKGYTALALKIKL